VRRFIGCCMHEHEHGRLLLCGVWFALHACCLGCTCVACVSFRCVYFFGAGFCLGRGDLEWEGVPRRKRRRREGYGTRD
jgi:hypothetical protein